jgi:hypothetical protein
MIVRSGTGSATRGHNRTHAGTTRKSPGRTDLGIVAHCHAGLGKLYACTGKREPAREHLTTATTMYREMGMTYWLEQAEAESRALS